MSPRIFIAIPLPSDLNELLSTKSNTLKEQFPFQKWVHPADYHITLKFIGDVDKEDVLNQIREAVQNIANNNYLFDLRIHAFGTFGKPSAPSILYASVQGNMVLLETLQHSIEVEMDILGFPMEKRRFHPHITVARRYEKTNWDLDWLSAFSLTYPPLPWTADRIVLYQSHLGKSPMYEPIDTFPLK